MTIEEMQKKKATLEGLFGVSLERFSKEAGVEVTGIEFVPIDITPLGDSRRTDHYGIRIEVKL